MNIAKSIEISLINKGLKKKDLAAGLGVSNTTIAKLCNTASCSSKNLDALSKFFELPASEFIKLGE